MGAGNVAESFEEKPDHFPRKVKKQSKKQMEVGVLSSLLRPGVKYARPAWNAIDAERMDLSTRETEAG